MEDVRRCVSKRANELDGRDESVIEKEVQKIHYAHATCRRELYTAPYTRRVSAVILFWTTQIGERGRTIRKELVSPIEPRT